MTITGYIRLTSNVSSRNSLIGGNRKATTIRSAGSQYFLARATLLASPLHRRAVAEEPAGPEDQDQDQDAEDHDGRPAGPDVLVGHRPDDPDQEPPDHRPGEVADAAEDSRREGVEPLRKTDVEDGD